MRARSLALLLIAACGNDGAGAKKDASLSRDTMVMLEHDAPPLVGCTPRAGNKLTVRQLGRVSGAAMLATSPPNDGRLFVVEQAGRIRVFENETLKTDPFLNISTLPGFVAGGESGLLGLAFHPNYAVNRQFFVFYTTDNANVVARYYVSETDINKADPAGEVVLSIPDFAGNHNGGMIEFGNDGYLYIGTGDGGGGNDPCRNGLAIDRTAASCTNPPSSCSAAGGTVCEPLLGKILRIDVNTTTGTKNYGIPSSNPYAGGGGEPEIFIRGLRNPWRWSFDRMTGDIYIGDVGQDTDEEVTMVPAAQQSGANLGWSDYEGTRAFRQNVSPTGVTMPQYTRSQNSGWASVIGGQVYRGTCFPDLVGDYFFTDHYFHKLMRGDVNGGNITVTELPTPTGMGDWPTQPGSIHADARGELILTTIGGYVYQIEAGP